MIKTLTNALLKWPPLNRLFGIPIVRQFAKFFVIGGTSAIIDFVTFFTLTGTITWFSHNILIANAISFLLAFTYNYSLNRRWTFQSKDPEIQKQIMKYFLMQLIGFGLGQLILSGSYSLSISLHLTMTLARFTGKFIAGGIVMVMNFFIGRYWVFKK